MGSGTKAYMHMCVQDASKIMSPAGDNIVSTRFYLVSFITNRAVSKLENGRSGDVIKSEFKKVAAQRVRIGLPGTACITHYVRYVLFNSGHFFRGPAPPESSQIRLN